MKINGESWDKRLLTRIDMVWGDPRNPELMGRRVGASQS
jgi:hypothetical protein